MGRGRGPDQMSKDLQHVAPYGLILRPRAAQHDRDLAVMAQDLRPGADRIDLRRHNRQAGQLRVIRQKLRQRVGVRVGRKGHACAP